jgi:MinD-like ATPase involved in chromosome partitioning or flagellar assembly
MTHLIGIVSAKGGVGKTTVAINLSYAFRYFQKNTILVDGDLTNPNLGIMLGIDNAEHHIQDSMAGKAHVSRTIHQHESGLLVIPGSLNFTHEDDFSHERLNYAISELVGLSDIVVVDSGSSMTQINQSVISSVDHVIAVTTPERAALTDTLKSIRTAKSQNKKILGVIVNKYQGHPSETRLEDIEGYLGERILGIVPHDKEMCTMESNAMPVVMTHPEGDAGISFKQIAAKLLCVRYAPPIAKPQAGSEPEPGIPGEIPTNIVPGTDRDESLFNYFMRRFGLK